MLTGFAEKRLDDGIDFTMGGMFIHYKPDYVLSPLFASAWAYDSDDGGFIWVSVDLIVVSEPMCEEIRKKVRAILPDAPETIIISATHTHTAPNTAIASVYYPTGDRSYLDTIWQRTAEACKAAWEDLSESEMSFARCDVPECTHNRRYLMESGKSMMHPGGPDFPGRLLKEGPEDPELYAIWFLKNDKPAAIIVNYQAHASILYGMHFVSADFPGEIRRVLKGVYGDIPILYLQGSCGNTTPIDHEHDATWGSGIDGSRRTGEVLAANVIRLVALTREKTASAIFRYACSTVELDWRETDPEDETRCEAIMKLFYEDEAAFNALSTADKALANKVLLMKEKRKDPHYLMPVSAMRLGELLFTMNTAEYFVEFQLAIKKRLGGGFLPCASITNGWCTYLPTKQAYLLKGYEVDQGLFTWDAGEKVENEIVRLAQSL